MADTTDENDHYEGALLEDIKAQNKAILEAVTALKDVPKDNGEMECTALSVWEGPGSGHQGSWLLVKDGKSVRVTFGDAFFRLARGVFYARAGHRCFPARKSPHP